VLCQLVVPVVMDFSREVTGARRLEMEDASAQGAMVISTYHRHCYPQINIIITIVVVIVDDKLPSSVQSWTSASA
jgi:hypothetical protein